MGISYKPGGNGAVFVLFKDGEGFAFAVLRGGVRGALRKDVVEQKIVGRGVGVVLCNQ